MAPRLEEQADPNTANRARYQFVGCGEVSSDAGVLARHPRIRHHRRPGDETPQFIAGNHPRRERIRSTSPQQPRQRQRQRKSLPTITRFPRRRPLSTLASAIMHVSLYAERTVATADRAGSSGGPAATLTAYTPPGRSARAVAAANSAVVSRGGVTAPANTSAITRS